MIRRWGWVLVGLLLALAAVTGGRWLPVFFQFITDNSDLIQGLTDFIQLLLFIGTAFVFLFGYFRNRQPPRQDLPEKSPGPTLPPPAGSPGDVNVGDRGVKIGGGVSDSTIITGDSNVINPPEDAVKTDPETLRRQYLNRIFESAGFLALTGIDRKLASDAEAKLSLASVYTALMTQSSDQPDRELQARLQEKEHQARRLSALEQFNRHSRLVLLGDPGSGKSTFVNFVALCVAGELLGRPEVNLALLTTPLPVVDRQRRGKEEKPEPQPWDHGALLPVRVILRDFAVRGLPAPGQPASAMHIWNFLGDQLERAAIGDYLPHLRKELRESGGILLIDGLDEVPESGKRREQIKAAVEDFARTHPRCRVLITSRTYAYQKQAWRLESFTDTELAPFEDPQIELFIMRWYDHIAPLRNITPEDAKGRAELLRRVVLGNPRLHSLAERPLLLTLMASLHAWRGGRLPEKREELYNDAVDLLLDQWETPKIVRDAKGEMVDPAPALSEWLKVDRQEVRRLLNRLAYEAHANQPEDQPGTADIPEEALIAGLMRLSNNQDVNPTRLVNFLSFRAGLLLPRGEGVYTMPHRTFQEYLAACHLTDDDYPDKLAELVRADPNRWREVALLAGAKAYRGAASTIWSLAEALCYRSSDSRDAGEADSWGALLAGQALVETADLKNVSERNQAKVERVRDWHLHILESGRLPAVERARAGDALAALGDPRFDPDHWHLPRADLLGFVEVPAGAFQMGSNPEKDVQAYDDEQPEHEVTLERYWISRCPITVAQFRVYVEASGEELEDPESLQDPDNRPVRWVSWYESLEYCRWLTEQLRSSAAEKLEQDLTADQETFWQGLQTGELEVVLPSEAEWEKAARGSADARVYPWSGPFDPEKVNSRETGIGTSSAVGCFPAGASPYGILDMSGNVLEWTRSLDYEKYRYPYKPGDEREDISVDRNTRRVLRGGSFGGRSRLVRCAFRLGGAPDGGIDLIGFRVVVRPR